MASKAEAASCWRPDGEIGTTMEEVNGNRKKVAVFGGSFDPATTAHFLMAAQLAQCGVADEVWVIPCGKRPDKNLHTDAITRFWMTKLTMADCLGIAVVEEVLDAAACAVRRTQLHGVSSDSFLATGDVNSPGPLSTAAANGGTEQCRGANRPDNSKAALSLFEMQFAEACDEMRLRLLDIEVRNGDFIPTFILDQRLRTEHPDCDIWLVIGEDLLRSLATWVEGPRLASQCRFIVVPRQLSHIGSSIATPTAPKRTAMHNAGSTNAGDASTHTSSTFMDLSDFGEAVGLDAFCAAKGFAFVSSSMSSTVARQRLYACNENNTSPISKRRAVFCGGAAAVGLLSPSTLRFVGMQGLYTNPQQGLRTNPRPD